MSGSPRPGGAPQPWAWHGRAKLFAVVVGLLVICFSRPLWALARYAWQSELYSYILLVPFITLYLIWSNRRNIPGHAAPSRGLALLAALLGLGILAGYWAARSSGWRPAVEEYLALMALSFLAFLGGALFLCLGLGALRRALFPVAMLLFIVPIPDAILQPVIMFLQHRSADVAAALFSLSGTPFLRQDTIFQLPGMPLEVAPECSGIHSTLVLFITSLVAGYLFLRSAWRRAFLSISVIPLALLRNGFRIFVIGQLCVHIGPDMINSPIHRKGGPLFFALSLIPFFLFLLWLRKTERKRPNSSTTLPFVANSAPSVSKGVS